MGRDAGLIRGPGALEDLSYLLYESSAFVSQAACLALATYGTQRSLEILTEGEEVAIRELCGWAQKGPSAARVDAITDGEDEAVNT